MKFKPMTRRFRVPGDTGNSRSGIRHGLDPKSQILAMHHYVTRRYGSFTRAKDHHVARRWY